VRNGSHPCYRLQYTYAKAQDLSDFESNEREAHFGDNFVSQTCCTEHTSRRERYIVMVLGVLTLAISGWETTPCVM
jgi:hypothetical protein